MSNTTYEAAVTAARAVLSDPQGDVAVRLVREIVLALKTPSDEVIDAGGSARMEFQNREDAAMERSIRETGGVPAFVSRVEQDTFEAMLDAVLRDEHELDAFRMKRGY
jgi:hypothetical protein